MLTKSVKPIEITLDPDDGSELASFNYDEGMEYVNHLGLSKVDDFDTMMMQGGYMESGGIVLVLVNPRDFPQVIRKPLY